MKPLPLVGEYNPPTPQCCPVMAGYLGVRVVWCTRIQGRRLWDAYVSELHKEGCWSYENCFYLWVIIMAGCVALMRAPCVVVLVVCVTVLAGRNSIVVQ